MHIHFRPSKKSVYCYLYSNLRQGPVYNVKSRLSDPDKIRPDPTTPLPNKKKYPHFCGMRIQGAFRKGTFWDTQENSFILSKHVPVRMFYILLCTRICFTKTLENEGIVRGLYAGKRLADPAPTCQECESGSHNFVNQFCFPGQYYFFFFYSKPNIPTFVKKRTVQA